MQWKGGPTGWTGVDMSTPLFVGQIYNSSKFDEKRLWVIFSSQDKDRYSFPLVYNSMISRSHLVCVAYSQLGIRTVGDVKSMMNIIFILSWKGAFSDVLEGMFLKNWGSKPPDPHFCSLRPRVNPTFGSWRNGDTRVPGNLVSWGPYVGTFFWSGPLVLEPRRPS